LDETTTEIIASISSRIAPVFLKRTFKKSDLLRVVQIYSFFDFTLASEINVFGIGGMLHNVAEVKKKEVFWEDWVDCWMEIMDNLYLRITNYRFIYLKIN
jgi:hypothetical protein